MTRTIILPASFRRINDYTKNSFIQIVIKNKSVAANSSKPRLEKQPNTQNEYGVDLARACSIKAKNQSPFERIIFVKNRQSVYPKSHRQARIMLFNYLRKHLHNEYSNNIKVHLRNQVGPFNGAKRRRIADITVTYKGYAVALFVLHKTDIDFRQWVHNKKNRSLNGAKTQDFIKSCPAAQILLCSDRPSFGQSLYRVKQMIETVK